MKIREGDIVRWNWGIDLECSTTFVVLEMNSWGDRFKVYSIQEDQHSATIHEAVEVSNNEVYELSLSSLEEAFEKGHTEKIFDITSIEAKNE